MVTSCFSKRCVLYPDSSDYLVLPLVEKGIKASLDRVVKEAVERPGPHPGSHKSRFLAASDGTVKRIDITRDTLGWWQVSRCAELLDGD
jgi:hypothetical protein